jgi:hypothetical protein
LAAWVQFSLPFALSLGIAAAAGFIMMLLTALLFSLAMRLKSPGAQFRLQDALGSVAEVYTQIPAAGTGKVSFAVNGAKHEADAVATEGGSIDSFEKVIITRIVDSHTVEVQRR